MVLTPAEKMRRYPHKRKTLDLHESDKIANQKRMREFRNNLSPGKRAQTIRKNNVYRRNKRSLTAREESEALSRSTVAETIAYACRQTEGAARTKIESALPTSSRKQTATIYELAKKKGLGVVTEKIRSNDVQLKEEQSK